MSSEEAHKIARAVCRKLWLLKYKMTEKDVKRDDRGEYIVWRYEKNHIYVEANQYLPDDIC